MNQTLKHRQLSRLTKIIQPVKREVGFRQGHDLTPRETALEQHTAPKEVDRMHLKVISEYALKARNCAGTSNVHE